MSAKGYEAGRQSAYLDLLRLCMRELPGRDMNRKQLLIERAATVAALREVCAAFGDNDWPDNLYLPDVLEKHLVRHLEDE